MAGLTRTPWQLADETDLSLIVVREQIRVLIAVETPAAKSLGLEADLRTS